MAVNEIFNDLNLVLQLNQHIQDVSVTAEGARHLSPSGGSSSTGSLTKQTSFKVLTNLESLSYSEPREDSQFDHQRSVFLAVSSCDLPFHLQGDKEFNEASAMVKRRALRYSESIKSQIEFLWEVAGGKKKAEMAQSIRQKHKEEDEIGRGRRGEQSVRRAANEVKSLLPLVEKLEEDDYMALMLLIFKVLRSDFVLELAHKQIQCDWEVDSHHGKSLDFDQFFAAIFELVDVWTCDTEEVTYERFLHLLARRITRRVAVFLDGAELKLSLSDNFEPEVVVKSIPLRTIPRFVSVARVVAATGMRTVGELASADPKVVERERVEFLQKNNGNTQPKALGEIRKIGQDLQTLLAMFKSISLEFQHFNYTLDNNILRRIPNSAASFPLSDQHKEGVSDNHGSIDQGQTRIPESEHDAKANSEARTVERKPSDVGRLSPRNTNNYQAITKSEDSTRQPQEASRVMKSSGHEGYTREALKTNHSGPFTHDNNLTTPQNSESARSGKPNTSTTPRAHGASESISSSFQPMNTIRDLQIADVNVVNVLRSTFLIEKAISIERQTELSAIRNELIKFGVDIEGVKLSEESVRDRYNSLYDMLVLRDGESLKSLANVMLEQIKVELSFHGIIVDDEEDIEDVYDGFFNSVVTGTGDSIVQDAQRWMENTVQDNKVNNYIQHDFHELKLIDEVKLLGTKRGDEELLALLTTDTDDGDIDESTESLNTPQSRNNLNVIQGKPSHTIAVPLLPVSAIHESQSRSPGLVEDFLTRSSQLEQVVTSVMENEDQSSSEKKKKVKKKKLEHENLINTLSAPDPQFDTLTSLCIDEDVKYPPGESQQEKSFAVSRKPKLTISTQLSIPRSLPERKSDVEKPNVGTPVEATDQSDDRFKHKRPTGTPRPKYPSTNIEVDENVDEKDHHDTSEQDTTRDALNIAIEFEKDEIEPGPSCTKSDGERFISLEPKVPQIVIGGASSAKNVPVTGRYIQLLGLGTVLITKDEREFYQLLRTHLGFETDLVCFDIGTEIATALTKLQTIQRIVGNRVILFGGNTEEPEETALVAQQCLANGALHFAMIPFNFPRLRETIMSFFESSKQPYILRQRKLPIQAAHVGSTIGAGSLFALHDEPRKVSTSVAFAKTPRRKVTVAIPTLPSLSHSSRESFQSISQGISEPRRADFTPIAPSTPRSSQSRNRSPRFSTSLNKLIR